MFFFPNISPGAKKHPQLQSAVKFPNNNNNNNCDQVYDEAKFLTMANPLIIRPNADRIAERIERQPLKR